MDKIRRLGTLLTLAGTMFTLAGAICFTAIEVRSVVAAPQLSHTRRRSHNH